MSGFKKWGALLVLGVSVVFCFLAVGRYLWIAIGPHSWGPRFYCSESIYDCGRVPITQLIKHDFIIKNTGRRPLHILKAVPACGACQTVKIERNEIQKGATGLLHTELNIGKIQKGNFVAKLLVVTNDPYLPESLLYIRGTSY